jgi:hypothetical protein
VTDAIKLFSISEKLGTERLSQRRRMNGKLKYVDMWNN